MKEHLREIALLLFSTHCAVAGSAMAQDLSAQEADIQIGHREYSPYLYQSYPDQVFFGDTHLHTSYSTDAGMVGNRLDPDAALRFAKGEEVVSSTGVRGRLQRPLDFLVVADHAENLGLAPMIEEANPELLRDPQGKKYYDLVSSGKGWDAYQIWKQSAITMVDTLPNPRLQAQMWNRIIDAVDRHNQPGVFTAFHGFEWSSTPQLRNMHRNVIFRDGADEARQVVPLSAFTTLDPEGLWDYMAMYEETTGGRALALPHNGNLSQGLMFSVERMNGEPIDADYARRRMKWEPIYEVTQIKGDGETHPFLSPNDEFADYYRWDKGDFGFNPKEPGMLQHEYMRSALKIGLEQAAKLGENPFKFGVVGSTDSHTSLSTTGEDNFFGKFSGTEPGTEGRYLDLVSQDLRPDGDGSLNVYHWESLASGLAAVWAQENTREAIWDAMARKEVYATTGTRMRVRVFAGWDFAPDDVQRPDFTRLGYQNGVPMGGDLAAAPEGAAPRLMVRVLRDPDGANIDRVQIVKGWLDASGGAQEKVFDIACANRSVVEGRCESPVGDTVDVENAAYTNTIGEALIGAYWMDPEFDPTQAAFYYVRVLEIPTPTWIAYDEAFFGKGDAPPEALRKHQERAYTSPIWYSPGG
ncbi:DUF3604 domain-containing protein [Defluviimonas sp. D31]|uniref:DUF3604 domain-containing protein n=1 Tax=Defluviimonas sp. D31 TaxID=3083253 RepID=UPI00296EE464|nr:DUF3604 domain-containing protein [Defluviimonas sp. D31]MDW4551281.1 DUF3604 domain-containing protein [Defluviimonas sp. D31]